jgi:RND family efflux transporter MFP subunit
MRRLPFLAFVLLVALSAVAATFAQAPGGGRPKPVVALGQVEQAVIATEQTFVGTVMPLRKSTVGSAVDGRVEEYLVNEGDAVTAGQPLARLRTRTIELEISAAQAELEYRRQELAELKNGARPEEIEQARARMAGAKALHEYTSLRLARAQKLFERKINSEDELQDVTSEAQQAEQAYLEAKVAYDLVLAGARQEKIAQFAARVLAQEEEIKRLEDRLDKHTIVAPFDGYVTKEHTEVGQWIKQGDMVAEVVDVSQVDVEALVLESYLASVQGEVLARVEVGAVPDEIFTGSVALVVPQADVRSRSFPVKIRLENEIVDGIPRLKPGMFARVVLPVGKRHKALVVPKDAIELGGTTPMVFVVDRDPRDAALGKARTVMVALGAAVEGMIQVRVTGGELKPGEWVVVAGNERLQRKQPDQPGQDVTIVPAAAEEEQAAASAGGSSSRVVAGDQEPPR